MSDRRDSIQSSLKSFDSGTMLDAALGLFSALGYQSKKRLKLKQNTLSGFQDKFPKAAELSLDRALAAEWKSIDFLFQITDEEVAEGIGFGDMFGSNDQIENQKIESYLFVAIDLKPRTEGRTYTRTDLSGVTRAINRIFPMPVKVLFRHGDTLSIAVINRRLHKRDASKDVAEKVTLVKDVSYADPIRAHIEILNDLSLPALHEEYRFTNFVGLHAAWEKRLATYQLNERFYKEIAYWYFDALQDPSVVMPKSIKEIRDERERDKQRSLFLIRLLTRLIFCWFLQEKRLLPKDLFRERVMKAMLKDPSPGAGTYYKAFLQNLFFATLNQEQPKRGWREKSKDPDKDDKNVGITNLWRYADLLKDPAKLEALLRSEVPFVNGGLFDCLDDQIAKPKVFMDGFSERDDNTVLLPNRLFFETKGHDADLSEVLHDKRRGKEKVFGLIDILSRYKFTIEENTPLEEEIALDPELLGKVFENLLASFNEDTQTTARKALGAFYTPRSVVEYMVDQALVSYLGTRVPSVGCEKLGMLLRPEVEGTVVDHAWVVKHLSGEVDELIRTIGDVRIIDHACGSGAFLLGALQRLVDLLQKLDPNNVAWKRDRLRDAHVAYDNLRMLNRPTDELERQTEIIEDVQRSFDTRFHELDFARKLYLIERCIYGVDIQPVATQVAKLRFFIALIVDQKVKRDAPNLGVRPMPNLETKVVAANALMPVPEIVPSGDLFADKLDGLKKDLLRVRHEHFNARDPRRKREWRNEDKRIREEIADILVGEGRMSRDTAHDLAAWDPYDQNTFANYFDPSWMFGFDQKDAGFDIVVANPPYVRQEKLKDQKAALKPHYPATFSGTADLYVYFYERALQLLRPGGSFSFITSNKWYRSGYGTNLRSHLGRSTSLLHVIDFGDAEVFTAIAYPTIVVGRKSAPTPEHRFQTLNWDPKTPRQQIDNFAEFYADHATTMAQTALEADGWRFIDTAAADILARIKAVGIPLGKFVDGRMYRGILTGLNEAFVIDRPTRDRLIAEDPKCEPILKPFLRGRDVKRWRIESADLWLVFVRQGTTLNDYKAIKRHLTLFREQLEPKPRDWPVGAPWGGRKAGSYDWFEIQDNIAYWKEFLVPKIVIPCIERDVSFAVDREGFFSNDKTSILIHEHPEALCAVLNSPIHWWYAREHYPTKQGGYVEFKPTFMAEFPVPKVLGATPLVGRLATIVLHLANIGDLEHRDSLMLGYFEQILNALVYELYFPEDLHARGLRFFDLVTQANIPDIETMPEPKRLDALRKKFEELYDTNHRLRGAIFDLGSLDIVRTIEGKA